MHERRGWRQRRMPRRSHGSFGLQRQRVPDVVIVVSDRLVLRVVRRRSPEEDENLCQRHARHGRVQRIKRPHERLQRTGNEFFQALVLL